MVDCSHLFSFLGYQIIALLPKGLYALLSVNQWKGCVFNFHRRHRFRIYVYHAYYLRPCVYSFFFINLKYKFILRLINKISRPQPIFITYFIFYLTKISITLQPILSHFFIISKLSN